MILSCLKLWNFRRFGDDGAIDLKKPHLVVHFRKGLNVLIGENDSGKSAIIDAIRLTLGTHSSEWTRIVDEDFFRHSTRLRIELDFCDLTDDEAKHLIEWLSIEGKVPDCHVALHVNFDVKRTGNRILPSDVNPGLGTLNRLFMASELVHLNKDRLARPAPLPDRGTRSPLASAPFASRASAIQSSTPSSLVHRSSITSASTIPRTTASSASSACAGRWRPPTERRTL